MSSTHEKNDPSRFCQEQKSLYDTHTTCNVEI